MKRAGLLLLVPLSLDAAEVDHSAHTAAEPAQEVDHSAHTAPTPPAEVDHSAHAAPAAEVDHSAHIAAPQPAVAVPQQPAPELAEAHAHMLTEHGAALNFLVLGERFEQSDADTQLWEAQAWLGYDRDKLWLKTEGEYDTRANTTERSEVQLLYSRAVASYWDLQAGLRHDDGIDTRTQAVIGLMGLAPYWFEIDAAAFVSEEGDFSVRLETEYELRFTQRLLLQPRLELDYSFAEEPALLLGRGLSELGFGLRLRYEWRREFAPYVGVEWSRAYGDTADMLHAAGLEKEEAQVVAGLRFWY